MKTFLICTVANKETEFASMKRSFIDAGFDEASCNYRLYSNFDKNHHDCYEAINDALDDATERYVIFAHQDVRIRREHGAQHLLGLLASLEKRDAQWAVAGNAGIGLDYESVRRITDPHGIDQQVGTLPSQVMSLDENILIVRTLSGIRCSKQLSGFHLYATDLCLNASVKGLSAYVIDFHLVHLSGGTISQEFVTSRLQFQQRWSQVYIFRYVRTPSTMLFLSRVPLLRLIFGSGRVTQWIFKHAWAYRSLPSHGWRFLQKLDRNEYSR
ncbi:MAG: hypothetical protein P4L33_18650 [Capsulimonadaceae bacterium]|nr:hypothetical protein [Capsulimonadaceae bacterium]